MFCFHPGPSKRARSKPSRTPAQAFAKKPWESAEHMHEHPVSPHASYLFHPSCMHSHPPTFHPKALMLQHKHRHQHKHMAAFQAAYSMLHQPVKVWQALKINLSDLPSLHSMCLSQPHCHPTCSHLPAASSKIKCSCLWPPVNNRDSKHAHGPIFFTKMFTSCRLTPGSHSLLHAAGFERI